MTLANELAALGISWAQEISIIVGVGALTITLIGHLLALHARQNETARGYVRAAHQLRALALAVIIVSGAGSVLVHLNTGTLGILAVPAFIFKWSIVIFLTALHFMEWKVSGWKRDITEGFEGANWYALLLVHTLAPMAPWDTILALYGGWLAAFGLVWAAFVRFMRRQTTLQPKPAQPPEPPKPTAPPGPEPAPIGMEKKTEARPNHNPLPMIAELDLPAPKTFSQEIPQKPQPETTREEKRSVCAPHFDIDHASLPAIQIMPKRPEDIGTSKRGPVVKLSGE